MRKQIGDLEFRLNSNSNGERYPEIARRIQTTSGEYSCYTLMFFVKNSEGYEINFIGDRPFSSDVNFTHLEALMRFGQKLCNALFEFEEQCLDMQRTLCNN